MIAPETGWASIDYTTTDGSVIVVPDFFFSSSDSEVLEVKRTGEINPVAAGTAEVIVKMRDMEASVPVTVNHRFEENVSLGSTKHATRCAGCGYVVPDSMEEHVYDDTAWTPNDNQTFVKDNTESNFCLVCNHEIRREIDGSAGYDVEFGEYQFLHDIMTYIDLLLDLIFGAIKR